MTNTHYVVTMYRHGWLHEARIVGVESDLKAARGVVLEVWGDGGNRGVSIDKWVGDEHERVDYYPTTGKEDGPQWCRRREFCEKLGAATDAWMDIDSEETGDEWHCVEIQAATDGITAELDLLEKLRAGTVEPTEPEPAEQPDDRVPQRCRWKAKGSDEWRNGVCWPLADGIALDWEFIARGPYHAARFTSDPSDAIHGEIGEVDDFEWLDNDCGWEPIGQEPTPEQGLDDADELDVGAELLKRLLRLQLPPHGWKVSSGTYEDFVSRAAQVCGVPGGYLCATLTFGAPKWDLAELQAWDATIAAAETNQRSDHA